MLCEKPRRNSKNSYIISTKNKKKSRPQNNFLLSCGFSLLLFCSLNVSSKLLLRRLSSNFLFFTQQRRREHEQLLTTNLKKNLKKIPKKNTTHISSKPYTLRTPLKIFRSEESSTRIVASLHQFVTLNTKTHSKYLFQYIRPLKKSVSVFKIIKFRSTFSCIIQGLYWHEKFNLQFFVCVFLESRRR